MLLHEEVIIVGAASHCSFAPCACWHVISWIQLREATVVSRLGRYFDVLVLLNSSSTAGFPTNRSNYYNIVTLRINADFVGFIVDIMGWSGRLGPLRRCLIQAPGVLGCPLSVDGLV